MGSCAQAIDILEKVLKQVRVGQVEYADRCIGLRGIVGCQASGCAGREFYGKVVMGSGVAGRGRQAQHAACLHLSVRVVVCRCLCVVPDCFCSVFVCDLRLGH